MVLGRRNFIQLGLSAAATAFFAERTVAASNAERVLRIGYAHSRGSQTDRMAEAFCAEVLQKTDGRIRIDRYYNSALGGEKEIAEDVAAGVLDFGLISSVGFAGPKIAPKLGVLDVPFLFRDLAHARAVLDGPLGKVMFESLRPAGLEGLAWGENGLRQITTSDKPVRSPGDLAGLKMRVPQSEATLVAFKGFGADAVAMPFPDVYAALADGSIAGQENAVNNIKSAEFDKVQKYLCLTDHIYSASILMVSSQRFDAIAPADRQVIRQAARNSTSVAREFNDSTRDSDISELRQRGMTVVSDVDRAAFIAASAAAQGTYETMFGKDAIRGIQNYRG